MKGKLTGVAAVAAVLGTLAVPTVAVAATTPYVAIYGMAAHGTTQTQSLSVKIPLRQSGDISHLWLNGKYQHGTTSGGWEKYNLTLAKGNNVVTAQVVDGSSMSRKESKYIVYGSVTTPTESVSGVTNNATVSSASQKITVDTQNAQYVDLWLNGKNQGRMTGSSATYNVTLKAGHNVITVIAFNDGVKSVPQHFYVTYSAQTVTTVKATSGVTSGNLAVVSGSNTVTLEALDQNNNVMSKGIIWSSSDTSVAPVTSTGSVIAVAPGSATITATDTAGHTATFKVTVAGQAAGIQVSAGSSSLVANGKSTDTITATVVDANGYAVQNFNGTVDFSDGNGQLVNSAGGTTDSLTGVKVTNGVAKVTVQATKVPGSSDKITVTNLQATGSTGAVTNASGNVSASTTVTQVGQVATSLKVSPSSATVENNVKTEDGFSVKVLDQAGQTMLTGTYPVNLTITGPGKFDSATQTTTAFVGNGDLSNEISGNIWSEQGDSGAITVMATSGSLTAGTATINSTEVGSPSALKLAVDSSSSDSFVAGSTDGTINSSVFDLSTVDTNGNTVTDSNNPSYTVTVWQGSTQITSGVTASYSNGEVTVTGTKAGSYTLKVTSSDKLAAATENFTITPNVATTVKFTSPANNIDLPIGSDSTTVVAQLEDAYGNAISKSGVPVEFTVSTEHGSDTATLDGSTTGKYAVNTDANGTASVSFVGSHTIGDEWQIGIDKVDGNNASATPVDVTMKGAVPTNLKVALQDTSVYGSNDTVYNGSKTYAEGGDTVTGTITATDSYGNPSPNGDTVQVTLPAGLTEVSGLTATSTTGVYTATLNGQGTVIFTATAATEGVADVQVKDLSVGSTSLTGSGSIDVLPGKVTGAAFFYNGKEITSSNELKVASNSPVEVTLEPVDSQGNPGVEGATGQYFNLSDGGFNGIFKSATNTGNVFTAEILPGSTGTTLWYQNAVAGPYDLSTHGSSQVDTVTQVAATAASSTVAVAQKDNVTLTAYDAQGNVVPLNGSENVTVSQSGSGAVTPSNTASVTFVNGVGTLALQGATVGTVSPKPLGW